MRVGQRTDAKTNQSALTLAQRRGIEGSSLVLRLLPGLGWSRRLGQDPLRKAEAKVRLGLGKPALIRDGSRNGWWDNVSVGARDGMI